MSEKKIPSWFTITFIAAAVAGAQIIHLTMAPHLDGIGEQVDFVGRLGTDIPTPLNYLLDETDSLVEVNMFYKTGKVVYRVSSPQVQVWLKPDELKVLRGMIENEKEANLPWNERPIEAVWDTGGIYYDSVWVGYGRQPDCSVEIPCPDNKFGCLVLHTRPCTPPKAGKPDAVDTLHDGTIIRTWIRDPNKVPEEK